MSMSAHIQELRRKHATLSDRVEAEQRKPGVDGLQIAEMKKQKLRIKEEIEKLSTSA
jgi:hypothetical protein